MNQLQKYNRDPEAVAFAREFLATLKDGSIPWGNAQVSPLTKAGSRAFVRETIKNSARHSPQTIMLMVAYARAGWDLFHEAARDLLLECNNRGEAPPTYLGAYQMDILAGFKPTTGNQKADRFTRNIVIASAVDRVVRRFNLKPTGRGAIGGSSACAIVSRAWNKEIKQPALSYKAIESIWLELKPRIFDHMTNA